MSWGEDIKADALRLDFLTRLGIRVSQRIPEHVTIDGIEYVRVRG